MSEKEDVSEEPEEIELPFSEVEMSYLDEEMLSLLELEMSRKKVSERVISAIGEYIEISKIVNSMGVTYRAIAVDTSLIDYLSSLYYEKRLSGEEEKIVGKIIQQDKLLRVWFADFIRMRNSFIVCVKERKLKKLKFILKKMELSVVVGKRLFDEINKLFRNYKKLVLEGYTEPQDVEKLLTYIE